MKKANANNAPKTETKVSAPERAALKFRAVDAIMSDHFENENKAVFDLVEKQGGMETVTLTIYPSDKDTDNAILNLFNFSIRGVIRSGKSGFFLSLPSYKGSDGKYYDHVTVYDKNFHETVKGVLAAFYKD